MKLKELATQILALPEEQQEQPALIQDDNTGEFVELTKIVIDDDSPIHLNQALDSYST